MTVLLGLLLTSLIGWLVIGKWLRGGWLAGIALGFAAGAGVLSLEMMAFSVLHLLWASGAVAAALGAAGVLSVAASPGVRSPPVPELDRVHCPGLHRRRSGAI